ncbi:MAG: tetratricopeptide repeat protein [Alphaproteobacteria bacterium]|nr:tetratricopeptide repeat protein [Alphaproteobacteria bacterium]MBN2779619.1 tetratricopeptide repeat protein [Alphaproteobacteria bacterium]
MQKLYDMIFKKTTKKRLWLYPLLLIPVLFAVSYWSHPHIYESKEKSLVDSGSLLGYVLAERYAQGTGDFKTASFYAEKMLQYPSEQNDDLNKKFYSYLILGGKFKKAELFIHEHPDQFKKNRLAQFLLLATAVKKNDYTVANTILEALQKGNEDQLALPLIKTWVLAGEAKKDTAFKALEALNNSETKILYQMHLFYLALHFKDFDKAYKALSSFKPDQFLNARFVGWAASFLVQYKNKEEAVAFIEKHLDLKNSYSNQRYLDVFKENPIPLTDLKVVHGLTESFIDLSLVLVHPKTTDLALFLARLASYISPDYSSAIFAQIVSGELLEKQHAYDDALRLFQHVEEDSLFYPSSLLKQARIYKKLENKKQAMKTYERLVEIYPDYVLATLLLGEMYVQDRSYKKARNLYENLIKKTADSTLIGWEVYYYLGLIYDWMGDKDNAEKNMMMAFDRSPKNPVILNYLGYFWIENGKNETQALEMIKTALTMAPTNVEFWDSYGWALYKMGEFEKAREILEVAVMRKASHPEIRDHLGDVYAALGRKRDALYNWKKALFYKDVGLGLRNVKAIERKISEQ